MAPSTKSIEDIRDEFVVGSGGKDDEPWYVHVVNSVSSQAAKEDALMKLVLEEMSQFYVSSDSKPATKSMCNIPISDPQDVVNDREFKQIELKYSSSRMVLYKIAEKVSVFDEMRDNVFLRLKNLQDSPAELFLNGAVDVSTKLY